MSVHDTKSGFVPEQEKKDTGKKPVDVVFSEYQLIEKYRAQGASTEVSEMIKKIPVDQHQSIAKKLIQHNEVGLLMYFIDEFQLKDTSELILEMCKNPYSGYKPLLELINRSTFLTKDVATALESRGHFRFVILFPEKFPEFSEQEILSHCIQNPHELYNFIKNIHRFPTIRHVDFFYEVFDANIDLGNLNLFESLKYFKKLPFKIVLELFLRGPQYYYESAIAQHIDAFELNARKPIAEFFYHEGYFHSLKNIIDRIEDIPWKYAKEIIQIRHPEVVFRNIEKFQSAQDDVALENHVMEKLKKSNILKQQFLVLQGLRQYEKLYEQMLFLKKHGMDVKEFISKDSHTFFYNEVFELMTENRPVEVMKIVQIGEMLDFTFINETTKQEWELKAKQETEKREQKTEQRDTYKTIQLSHEIVRFYTTLSLLYEIDAFEKFMIPNDKNEDGNELSFSKKMELFYLKEELNRVVDTTVQWIREYLVKAVFQEIQHQFKYMDASENFSPVTVDSSFENLDDFLVRGTNEEIIQFLDSSRIQFLNPTWGPLFGGKKWADIADVAKQLWVLTDKKAQLVWVDRAFDLEHNTGFVFNKDDAHIKYDKDREKRLLDFKRDAKESTSLISTFLEEVHDTKVTNDILRWQAQLKKLKMSAHRKHYGGD